MAISKEQPMRPALIDVVEFANGQGSEIEELQDLTAEHTRQIEDITEVQAQYSEELQTEIERALEAEQALGLRADNLAGDIAAEEQARENADDALQDAIDGKQDMLVSGENIKTFNSQSILGSGNIDPEFMRLDFSQELNTELLPISDDTAATSNTGRVDIVLPAEYQADWAIVDLNKYELKNGSTRVDAVPMFKITMSGQTIIRVGFKTSGSANKQVNAISGGLLLIRRS